VLLVLHRGAHDLRSIALLSHPVSARQRLQSRLVISNRSRCPLDASIPHCALCAREPHDLQSIALFSRHAGLDRRRRPVRLTISNRSRCSLDDQAAEDRSSRALLTISNRSRCSLDLRGMACAGRWTIFSRSPIDRAVLSSGSSTISGWFLTVLAGSVPSHDLQSIAPVLSADVLVLDRVKVVLLTISNRSRCSLDGRFLCRTHCLQIPSRSPIDRAVLSTDGREAKAAAKNALTISNRSRCSRKTPPSSCTFSHDLQSIALFSRQPKAAVTEAFQSSTSRSPIDRAVLSTSHR
jgi:hypothetical protein